MFCQAEKEPDTAYSNILPGTVDFINVFNSETIPKLLAVSFGTSYLIV